MPTHAKMPSAMKREMCAHGGALRCGMGCYSKGGEVKEKALFEKRHKQHKELAAKRGEEYGKDNGVHAPSYSSGRDRGQSIAGDNVRGMPYYQGDKKKGYAVDEHHRVLGEMRNDKTDRRNLAEGGDVEPLESPMEGDGDQEIEHALAGELLSAVEKKDKQGVVDAIEALVMQCMSKGGSDV